MLGKVDISDEATLNLAKRIIVRMGDQSEPEIVHVLTKLFPNSPALRLKSVGEDLSNKRINAENEFLNLLGSDDVDMDVFNALSSADRDPSMIFSRSQFEPTKFILSLTCLRTPFKEFFEDCKDITCEECIQGRITKFETKNEISKSPWVLKLDKVEQRRVDLCKNCGQILTRKDGINMQNERLLYKCSYCGHKGWNKAK